MRYGLPALIVMLGAAAPQPPSAREVTYAPEPGWVQAAPAATGAPTPEGSPIRFVYNDTQARVVGDRVETYTAYRVKILKPKALALGNLTLTWQPTGGGVTVHHVRIIRDGQPIDLLAAARFQVIEREANLDKAALDGNLTAVLHAPGLQVGDELDVAATITSSQPALGGRAFGFGVLPPTGMPGAYRFRVLWPRDRELRWQTTPDLKGEATDAPGGARQLAITLTDPPGSVETVGAPPRYNLRRLIEFSEYGSWPEVSRQVWPLFDHAATLGATSPVKAEAARIAAASTDPAERMRQALMLVQDRIRYVYVGLDGANYRPATPDETWTRRFGDCKAKTVLLLALLRDLGVIAEPVLVDLKGGDGTDQQLPSPAMFNHVLVRATIGTKRYWLDGTGLGDRHLELIDPPTFRWALPLSAAGAALEPVPAEAPRAPQMIDVLDLDASGGTDKPAKVKERMILRGSETQSLRSYLASLPASDAERAVKTFWQKQNDWLEPESASWRFDEDKGMLILSVTGAGNLNWTGAAGSRMLDIFGAGFVPPEQMHRPKEQDQDAPWQTAFPGYRCWSTTIHLPPATPKSRWTYYADPMNRELAGTLFWRRATLTGPTMRTVMSRKTLVPEISAQRAAAANKLLPGFNNNVSRVYEEAGASVSDATPPPFGDTTDWTAATTPCNAP